MEAQRKLEEERKRLEEQANEAVAKEEVRKVLEQTARMREEEAAKIKAAVAGLRADAAAERQAAQNLVRKDVEDAHRATRNRSRNGPVRSITYRRTSGDGKRHDALKRYEQNADCRQGCDHRRTKR